MKTLLLIALIFSFEINAKDEKKKVSHAGHKHKAGEECDVLGSGSGSADKLAKDVSKAVEQLELSPDFCKSFNQCYGYGSESDCSNTKSYYNGNNQCSLGKQEYAALSYYMGSGYGCINSVLFGVKKDVDVKPITTSLNQALKKFPRYDGFVARGTALPETVFNEHKVGAVITYNAFTSTSVRASIAEGFSQRSGKKSFFLIYSHSGRPVMGLSQGEGEVLFASGTKFKVLNHEKDSESSYFLMREVPPGETPAAASKADQLVMAKVKALETNPPTAYETEYSCPRDGKMEKVLKQVNAPSYGERFKYFSK